MSMLTKRQVIILAAFCLPLFALVGLSYVESGQQVMPKLAPKRAAPIPTPASLAAEREKYKRLLEQAVAMSPQDYLERKKTDPTFLAPNVEVRRDRLAKRLSQLEHTTPEQWAAEQAHKHPDVAPAPAAPVAQAATQPAAASMGAQTTLPKNLPPIK